MRYKRISIKKVIEYLIAADRIYADPVAETVKWLRTLEESENNPGRPVTGKSSREEAMRAERRKHPATFGKEDLE